MKMSEWFKGYMIRTFITLVLALLFLILFSSCSSTERIPRGYPTQGEQLRLKMKDYKAVNKDYSKQLAKLHKRDSLYRCPEWRRDREKQEHIFYPIAIGGPFFLKGLDIWYSAYLPI